MSAHEYSQKAKASKYCIACASMQGERLAMPASELPAFGSSRPKVASVVARAPPLRSCAVPG
eukprot:3014259-Alexandrium_andersonii.AAC.1